jgi:tRNA(fMet)-specific endonuclease VapC
VYLIDTDIIVFSLKQNVAVQAKFKEMESVPKAISVVTYGELLYGAHVSQQRQKNLAVVRRLADIFPVIGVGIPVIEAFAELKRSLEIEGQGLDDMDLLIAATALSLNYRLVTNNMKHFSRVKGLEIENWLS